MRDSQLFHAAKTERTLFEVPTVLLHVHECVARYVFLDSKGVSEAGRSEPCEWRVRSFITLEIAADALLRKEWMEFPS